MKKLCLLLCLILALAGCSVKDSPVLETLSDSLPAAGPLYRLQTDYPAGLFQAASSDDGDMAIFLHEHYELIEQILPAASAAQALLQLTGLPEPFALCLSRGPVSRYRYSFRSHSEQGELACSGVLFFDGAYAYSLCAQCPQALEKHCRQEISALLSAAELVPIA